MSVNIQYEFRSWKKKLDVLQQENILLKNRVADIIKNDVNNSFLEKVEYFFACFLEKDAVLALLRHDVADIQKRIGKNIDADHIRMIEEKCETLRKDITKMEFEFYKLKQDFNNYIGHTLSAN